MQACFHRPPPAAGSEGKAEMAWEAAEVSIHDGLGRRRGMEIDGDVKSLGCLKERSEFRIVQKLSVNGAVHHDAFEPQPADAALEFGGSFLRLLQGKCGES